MDRRHFIPLLTGLCIALAGSIIMLILLCFNLVGPKAVENDLLMYGGTLLFISLYILLLVGLFICLSKFKKLNGNSLTFKQALLTGFLCSISTAIFSVIFTIIFYELIYPGYMPELQQILIEKLDKTIFSQEEITEKIKEQTLYYSTWTQAKFSFIGNLITGMAFTLMLSLFLKSKAKKNTIK